MKLHSFSRWCLIGACTALLCGCVTETTVDDEPETYGSFAKPPSTSKTSIWKPSTWFKH